MTTPPNAHDLSTFYTHFAQRVEEVRQALGHPLTYAEKVLLAHLYRASDLRPFRRGEDYAEFRPDRVAMQDATAQMALLQFMNAGKDTTAVPATVHCDHLIQADRGATDDLARANEVNREVYDFLQSASDRYGIGFWRPGAGIIHQIVLENYALPGGMMVGTDSHTPNAGGLGMAAIGVGGADAVDVMAGLGWELKIPRIIGVRLSGRLSGWASPKDVILKLAGLLTTKGATNAIIEYFGPGAAGLSATGKATICNMGAEVGATCSLFPFDEQMAAYLAATGRQDAARLAQQAARHLQADPKVYQKPEDYYDRVIEIDLDALEPYVNGPFTPDAATTISALAERARQNGYPEAVEAVLIGSCTNSSYQDLYRAAAVVRQALQWGLKPAAPLIINPGSERVYATAERDGLLDAFRSFGATIMANACGPCIGQWKRHTDHPDSRNTIVTTFNRNFAKRADGNPNTYAFIASPEMAVAFAIGGRLTFNPLTDHLKLEDGTCVALNAPADEPLPRSGFVNTTTGFVAPTGRRTISVNISPDSQRLQRLAPFAPWNAHDFDHMKLLIKTEGKCTTDHISMAGPWLRFRGHLERISDNLLMGAVNAFTHQVNSVLNPLTRQYEAVSTVAKQLKQNGISSIVVAEDNYGEGSSREHAAMEPRFLNVKAVLAKSFARIHETNLKKQGVLALTFVHKEDYQKVREDDELSILGLDTFAPGRDLRVVLHHADGSTETLAARHTYNPQQISWLQSGSALNALKTSQS